jgi:activating signal cointegrator complex subunit 3
LHHAGLVESDRQLAEELFANNKIQVLVATSTLAFQGFSQGIIFHPREI